MATATMTAGVPEGLKGLLSAEGREVRKFWTKKGMVNTHLTDAEAVCLLEKADGPFAKDLRAGWVSSKGLSVNQLAWAHKIALEVLKKLTTPAPAAVDLGGDMAAILGLFKTAAAHLRHPKVRMVTAEGTPVVLSVAGPSSKYAGQVQVTDGAPYPTNRYFGRVGLDGQFTPYKDCTPDVTELLARFAKDPAGTAAECGKLMGSCCFCNTKLTDEKSTEVGYGPVCAKHYGLPWGGK